MGYFLYDPSDSAKSKHQARFRHSYLTMASVRMEYTHRPAFMGDNNRWISYIKERWPTSLAIIV